MLSCKTFTSDGYLFCSLTDAQAGAAQKCQGQRTVEYIPPGVTDDFINHMKNQDRYYLSDFASSYYPHIFPYLQKPEIPYNISLFMGKEGV